MHVEYLVGGSIHVLVRLKGSGPGRLKERPSLPVPVCTGRVGRRMSDYYICDACGHNVPVHNRVLHGFSCAAGERKKKKVKSSSSASAAGATKKRASNGDGGGSKKSQDAGGGGAGGGQRKRKSAVVKEPDLRTEDEKKEERKRKAEERRKRDMDELKKKIRHARNKDQYRSAYEVSRQAGSLGPAPSWIRGHDKFGPSWLL